MDLAFREPADFFKRKVGTKLGQGLPQRLLKEPDYRKKVPSIGEKEWASEAQKNHPGGGRGSFPPLMSGGNAGVKADNDQKESWGGGEGKRPRAKEVLGRLKKRRSRPGPPRSKR